MNSNRPLLVVTPTLGHSPWLDRTVASVTAYAGKRAAHVLVAPPSVGADLRQRFPHCTVVEDTAAKGVYAAINLGLVHAPDPNWGWFTWINDDDEFTPGFAPHLARALEYDGRQSAAPWCYGQVRLLDGRDDYLGRLAVAHHTADIATLAQGGINPLNQQGLLTPRFWILRRGPLREDLRICADVDFWLRALMSGATFRYSPETVAVFRLHAGQISGNVAKHKAEFHQVVATLSPRAGSKSRQLMARLRFRLANAGVYLGRIRRSGWKGGYALLQQPEHKPT